METLRQRIARFWNGSMPDAERRALLDELEMSEEEIRLYHWQQFNAREEGSERITLTEEQRRHILQRVHARISASTPKNKRKTRKMLLPALAAAALVLFVIGFSMVFMRIHDDVRRGPSGERLSQAFVKKLNESDSVLTFILPDRSAVRLSPQSALTYAPGFNFTHRNLSLSGDARFDVAKNPAIPFRVEAQGYEVTAIGTVFRVDARGSEKMHVQLLEGKIAVFAKSHVMPRRNGHVLTPGEELLIDLKDHRITRTDKADGFAQPDSVAASLLKQHPAAFGSHAMVLRFDDTPVKTVIAQLERVYGKKISYGNDVVAQQTYRGRLSFYEEAPLHSLPRVMSFLFNDQRLEYKIENDQIIITKTN